MSYLLADKLSHRIAAIASVAGPMGTATCAPKHPVPICHIHGDKDDYAPFAGGIGAKSLTKTNFYSVEHSVQNWVRANGCRTTAEVEKLPAKADDGTHVTRTRYTGGKDGAEVLLYTIHGGGHTWPGRENKFPLLGKVSKNLNANDVIWEFVKPHRRAL
jgi:polyhydroxybutyrate depolymerase